MDEPSANIDVENVLKIMELVMRLGRELNQSFIIATRDYIVARSCSAAYKMRDGLIMPSLQVPISPKHSSNQCGRVRKVSP
jgi:ABC-type lipoprotein export system ATPase subunit